MQQLPLAMRLRERADFDSFVPGPNAAAVEQLRAVLPASAPGSAPERPAVVHRAGALSSRVYWVAGPRGVGKSHLLQASCSQALSRGQSAQYLPLSQLMSLGPEVLTDWRTAGVLALDELAVVIGQRDWEQALFGLYRDGEQHGALLLAAAELPPSQLPFVLPDLASRFAAAMLLQLRPLDELAQRQALQRRARARGLELPEDAARYLQRHFRRDLPTLCQLLDAIDDASLRAQRRLTIPFIRAVLAAYPPPSAE